tara:strand:- start:134 stop:499 length:366 start_codon:yes stop_codon:yes gene_type:complete
MGTVNCQDGKHYLDFQCKGIRCREQTLLSDTQGNRQKLGKILLLMEQQSKAGTFDYEHHFPNSLKVEHFRYLNKLSKQKAVGGRILFSAFASQWLNEKRVEWWQSHYETVEGILRCHLATL